MTLDSVTTKSPSTSTGTTFFLFIFSNHSSFCSLENKSTHCISYGVFVSSNTDWAMRAYGENGCLAQFSLNHKFFLNQRIKYEMHYGGETRRLNWKLTVIHKTKWSKRLKWTALKYKSRWPKKLRYMFTFSDKSRTKKPLAYVSRVRASMRHCDLKWSFFDGLSNAIKLLEKNGYWIWWTDVSKCRDRSKIFCIVISRKEASF